MAALPYLQFFPADYLADTMHLTLEEHGAYLLLIMNYWQTGKPLPDNDRRMSSICSTSVEKWLEIKPILNEFFILDDNGDIPVWRHPRLDFDLQKTFAKSEKCRRAGKKSASNRLNNKENPASVQRPIESVLNHRDTDKIRKDTDKHITPLTPLLHPDGLNLDAWVDYEKYRVENKIRKLKPQSVKRQQKWLIEQGDEETQREIIDRTIRQGYQGLHPLQNGNGTGKKSKAAQFLEDLKNA